MKNAIWAAPTRRRRHRKRCRRYSPITDMTGAAVGVVVGVQVLKDVSNILK